MKMDAARTGFEYPHQADHNIICMKNIVKPGNAASYIAFFKLTLQMP